MNNQEFINELSKLRPSSTFLTLKGYRNEYSEIADYNIIFHMSYENALKRSIVILKNLSPISDLEIQAQDELLISFNESLRKLIITPIEKIEDGYKHFIAEDGSYIKGIKLHIKSNTLHLYGLVQYKRVLMPGLYPHKNHAPLTVVKNKMRYLTPAGKFRQFKMLSSQVDLISVENLSLLPPI